MIVLLTAAVAGAAVSQFFIFEGQLEEMRAARIGGDKAAADQMAVMREQAKAMQGQLNQMSAAQRPWLKVAEVKPKRLVVVAPFVVIVLDLEITNVGHQPAEGASVNYKVYRSLGTAELRSATEAACGEGAARAHVDLSETIFPDEIRPVDQYAFAMSILDIEKDRDARVKKGFESTLELKYPLRSGFYIAGCITYTYGNGSALGQTAFVLDINRRCPESPVGKCSFDIVAGSAVEAEDIVVTEERRGVFAR